MQRVVYIQSIATPKGLIANLFGFVEGQRHDGAMLAESNLSAVITV